MNQFKNAASKFSAQIPKGGAPPGGGNGIMALFGLGLGGYGIYKSMVTVQPGHKGIIYNRMSGLDDKSHLNEGLNFVLPWLQRAIVYDVRTRPQPIDTISGSKDLQMVQISLRVLFKPDPNRLHHIYRQLGQDYDVRVLPSIVNEVTKAVVAKYNASELLTKRNEVSTQIRMQLMNRARDFAILLDDVAITHLAFSKEYTNAVEAKQVALQDSQRARYIVERAIQEKKSIVIKAEGEAKSAELIGNAIQKNPAFLQLRRIEAAKEIAATLSGSGNKVYLNADSLMINTLGESSAGKNKAASGGWM